MKNDEIRQANRKALPKFILSMTIFMLVGGAVGYLSARYGLDRLTGGIKSAGEFFGAYIAPWLMLVIAVIMPIVCGSIQRRVKRMIESWDGEDEDVYGIIDRKISLVGWISGSALIVSDFLMAASYSKGFKIFESTKTTALFLVAVVSVFAVIIEMMIIGQKCVDFAKRINPEKKASFYDAKFSKKWMDTCDEAEKIMIGKCAFKAYSATNKVCAISAGVLTICALVFNIGFLPSLAVCLVWIVNSSVYCIEAMKYSKAGNKIS